MDNTLKAIKDIYSDCCITICLNTHKTTPDNQKDPILLKSLMQTAEQRLQKEHSLDKIMKDNLMSRLKNLSTEIDYRHNLESLILFVDKDTATYVRLPIAVEDRVIIGNTFATRDLIRAMHIMQAIIF